jgi:hypothetical protein
VKDTAFIAKARTQMAARRDGKACEGDNTLASIVASFQAQADTNPDEAQALAGDGDFSDLTGSVAWRRLIWPSDKATDADRLLVGTTFYSPPAGAMGNEKILQLGSGGKGITRTRSVGDEGEAIEEKASHTWTVSGDTVTVTATAGVTAYTLNAKSNLVTGDSIAWYDLPSECGA